MKKSRNSTTTSSCPPTTGRDFILFLSSALSFPLSKTQMLLSFYNALFFGMRHIISSALLCPFVSRNVMISFSFGSDTHRRKGNSGSLVEGGRDINAKTHARRHDRKQQQRVNCFLLSLTDVGSLWCQRVSRCSLYLSLYVSLDSVILWLYLPSHEKKDGRCLTQTDLHSKRLAAAI